MKYAKFIIILIIILSALTACKNEDETAEAGEMPTTYNYASGSMGYPVLLNGIGIELLQAGIVAENSSDNPNYVNIILALTVTNESDYVAVPPAMTLVDDHNNIYVSQQEPLPYEEQLTRMPLSVTEGEGFTGNLVFIVPAAAVQDNLRLRWQSETLKARIDVFLGPLGQRATS